MPKRERATAQERQTRERERRELRNTVADSMPYWAPWRFRRLMRLTMRASELVAKDNANEEDARGKKISPRNRAETTRANVQGVREIFDLIRDAQNNPVRRLALAMREGSVSAREVVIRVGSTKKPDDSGG